MLSEIMKRTLTPTQSLDRLRQHLPREPQRLPAVLHPAGAPEAAVLVPLVHVDDDLALVLTVRPTHLRSHPGQIAFPGGKRDPEDVTLIATALREADEELGLRGAEVLGFLQDIPTPAGIIITPVVGLMTAPVTLTPNAAEVAESFLAPLATLRAVYRAGMEREFFGHRFIMHEFLYQRWRIWGATAAMIHQLLGLMDQA